TCRGATASLVFPLLFAALPAHAQIVRGTVVEEGFDKPIDQAEVVLVDKDGKEKAKALTDSLGIFRIEVEEAGRYSLSVRRLGFVTVATHEVEVGTGETVAVELRMSAQAIPLEPLVVVQRRWYDIPRLAEFYERAEWNAKLGRGKIYFREDLDRFVSLRHLAEMTLARPSCPMEILVDGLPIDHPSDLDAVARPDVVEGVEIYRGPAQVPVEFSYRGSCALMLVWTRPMPGRPFSWKRILVA